MMEWIKNILVAVFGLVSLIATPLAIVKTDNAKKESTAKVEAERAFKEAETVVLEAERKVAEAEAEIDLKEKMEDYACSTEHGFETFDKVAKANGGKCSVMKKEWLLMKLQNYAMRMGYTFDLEKWESNVDTFIGRTVEINSKK